MLDAAAARAGVDASWIAWRDPSVDWGAHDVVVIHSPWDYHEARDEFVAWAERVEQSSRLCNPAAVVAWNSHKGYLLDLVAWGVPTIATRVVRRVAPEAVASIAEREGWSEVVVKPAIGAGAIGTSRWRADDPAADQALTTLLEDGDALVQPFLPEVQRGGETSIIVFDGVVSHAVSKVPAAGDFRVQTYHGGVERRVEPTAGELEVALGAVTAVGSIVPVTYARVDCVTVDDRPQVMELEVLEPYLYLSLAPPDAADRLLAAVLAPA